MRIKDNEVGADRFMLRLLVNNRCWV
jgi:hypothetical protein